jgi:hypothetical protein
MADDRVKKVVEIDVKASGDAVKVLREMQKSMRELEDNAQRAEKRMQDLGSGLKGVFAAVSFHQVVGAFKSVIDAMDELNDKSAALGLSVEQLSEWNHIASMSGASAQDLETGINGLAKSMNDLGNETSQASKFLTQAGVTAGDTTDAALTKLADAFQKLQDGPQKTALAMDIFGKAGAKLIPMLNNGREGIKQLKEEAARLGIVLSTEGAEAAARFNDNVDRVQKSITAVSMQIVEGMMPALNAMIESLTGSAEATDAWKEAGDALGGALVFIEKTVMGAVTGFKLIGKAVATVLAGLDTLTSSGPKAALAAISAGMEDIEQTAIDGGAAINKLDEAFERARFNASREFVGPKMPAGSGAGTAKAGAKEPKEKVDETRKALEQFIDRMKQATQATQDLTHAEELEVLMAGKQAAAKKLTTDQLKEAAKAAASAADTAEFNAQREKERLDFEQQRTKELADTRAKDAEGIRKQAEAFQQLKAQFLEMANPVSRLTEAIDQLDDVLADMTLTDAQRQSLEALREVLGDRLVNAMTHVSRATMEAKDNLKALGEEVNHGLKAFAADTADAIVDAFSGAKVEIDKIVGGILASIAKVMLQRVILQGLDAAFPGLGLIPVKKAHGGIFDRAGAVPFASGGVVSSPTAFAFAGGAGLMGEAGPEAIVPLKRGASGDLGVQASPVNVQVINNTPATIRTEEAQSINGERQLRIMVDRAVEESLGGGRFDRVMSTAYGMTRRGR